MVVSGCRGPETSSEITAQSERREKFFGDRIVGALVDDRGSRFGIVEEEAPPDLTYSLRRGSRSR